MVICGSEVVDPCQAHCLYQAALQRFEQSLDRSFRPGLCAAIHSIQSPCRSTLARIAFAADLHEVVREVAEGRPFESCLIGVMGQRTSINAAAIPQTSASSLPWCRAR